MRTPRPLLAPLGIGVLGLLVGIVIGVLGSSWAADTESPADATERLAGITACRTYELEARTPVETAIDQLDEALLNQSWDPDVTVPTTLSAVAGVNLAARVRGLDEETFDALARLSRTLQQTVPAYESVPGTEFPDGTRAIRDLTDEIAELCGGEEEQD
ncbi:hypothetical protein GCM10027425_25860 [Alteromonas gracilis]